MALEGIRRTSSAIDPKDASGGTPAAAPKRDFTAVMQRIAARAESVETLKNGAKLYHLPNGREVEQVPGKSPYVTKKGTPPPASTSSTTTPPPATTAATPSTTAPAPSTTDDTPTK
jgi:hypothetical protein